MQSHGSFENRTMYSTCDFDHQKNIDIFLFLSCGLKCGYSFKDIKGKCLLILDYSENSLQETNENNGA